MRSPVAEPIRVVIADDHPLMRSGIRTTLADEADIVVVAEASDGCEMELLCREHLPDVLIMDISMPGPPFVERVESVKSLRSDIKVLVLTAFDDSVYIQALFKAGIEGYALKDEVAESLPMAVRLVARGGSYFSRRVLAKLNEFDMQGDALATLTPREREVLRLIARGLDNLSISSKLGLADQTVRNHVSRLYSKVGLDSRVELAIWALKHGLIDGEAGLRG